MARPGAIIEEKQSPHLLPHCQNTILTFAVQTVGSMADGNGEASGRFEESLGAAAALREGLTEERTLLTQYKSIAWGRVLTPVQVGLRRYLFCCQP